jgi:hypothetical protein
LSLHNTHNLSTVSSSMVCLTHDAKLP